MIDVLTLDGKPAREPRALFDCVRGELSLRGGHHPRQTRPITIELPDLLERPRHRVKRSLTEHCRQASSHTPSPPNPAQQPPLAHETPLQPSASYTFTRAGNTSHHRTAKEGVSKSVRNAVPSTGLFPSFLTSLAGTTNSKMSLYEQEKGILEEDALQQTSSLSMWTTVVACQTWNTLPDRRSFSIASVCQRGFG